MGASFDWSGYLKLAEELGNRPDEASLRSALSRAYYYVYHLALNRAEANRFQPLQGEGTHTQLWRLYKKNPEPACLALALIAERLKEKRERADYRSQFVRIEDEVPEVLKDAREFAAKLAKLPPRHPSPQSVRL